MTDKLKSQYFESDDNGNFIGYHVEGGEIFKNVGEVSLTKMNIDGTRPLFLCNNPKEWYPEHLPNNKDTYKVLKVVFKPIKEHVVTKVKDFNKREPTKEERPFKSLVKMMTEGCQQDRYWVNTCINALKEKDLYNKIGLKLVALSFSQDFNI